MREELTHKATRATRKSKEPTLKAALIPVYRVHYEDLEKYIEEVFGFDYDFLFATGYVAGMCPEYQVTGVIPSIMSKQVSDLRSGQRTRNVNLIVNLLAADGYIPCGKYVIDTHQRPDPISVYRNLLLKTRDSSSTECRRFKTDYGDDAELMKRVRSLDQAMTEQRKRARR